MMDARAYVEEVDSLMEKLRNRCLGMDTEFKVLLPEGSDGWNEEEKAKYIAKIILFALVGAAPVSIHQSGAQRLADWLYAAVLYLEMRCSPTDHTFASIRKLVDLDLDTRKLMFHKAPFQELQKIPHWALCSTFEIAVQTLLDSRPLAGKKQDFFTKVQRILQ